MIDIERLAREAGFIWIDDYLVGGSLSAPQPDKPLLKYFAALVLDEAAKVCDEVAEHPSLEPRHCAASIRALKEKP